MYDSLLQLKLPRAITPVAFADDIALVIVGKYLEDLRHLFNVAYERYQTHMEHIGLKLADHKTEAVLITSRKLLEDITLRVGDHDITSQPSIRYLGVMIDSRLNFKEQVEYASKKASRVGAALSRLMPNIGGPKQRRRALLASVVTSVLSYGIAIWADALKIQETLRDAGAVQRTSALRIARAFSSVSKDAADVIAGMLPIELLANERKRIYQRRRAAVIPAEDLEAVSTEERNQSLRQWQRKWDDSETGRWTHTLIPNVEKWVYRQHGEVNHSLTQMLTGHGCFRAYLYKRKHEDSSECPSCSGTVEDAEHVIFTCPRFKADREKLQEILGSAITPRTLVDAMLSSKTAWDAATAFSTAVIRQLRREEQNRKMLG